MKWLNYNHLYYFWMVAREGGVGRASEELMVSQPTVSIQLKELEASLGHRLFDRAGRRLVLTDAGKVAFNYANEIFSLGRDLIDALDRQPADRPLKLAVGIVDVIPKRVVRHLLEPALRLQQAVRLICREDKGDRLLADLAARRLDVVIGDAPIGTGVHVQGHNHLLVECGVSFLATRELAAKYRRGFPKSLNGAPLLLPSDHTAVRQALNAWLDSERIHPRVVGEFDDTALMMSIGQNGVGVFPFPSVVERQARKESGVALVGRTDAARERFYAISVEEKLKHPAVAAICEAAGARASHR
jgi:LysR family transcriptional activator of nhaA